MKMEFKPTFIKDFKKLPLSVQIHVKEICFSASIFDKKNFDIASIKGFKGYFRIRLGDYRIGFKKEKESVIFMRVKHRKDIYKFFP